MIDAKVVYTSLQEPPEPWKDSKTAPLSSDYVKVLTALGYDFKLNVCNDVVEVNGAPITDVVGSQIRSRLRDLKYNRVNVAEDAWIAHAYDKRYHPVRDFLERLAWDGEDYITALAYYIHADKGDFYTLLKRWLVGAVARACEEDGCQNRMLVLDGKQGKGKSYLVKWLANAINRAELFTEGPINPADKDCALRLITTWIWEVGELSSTTRKADRDALKYFLSQRQVTVRKPYGHYDLVKPALSSFVGTLNDTGGFLNDPTGSRRFMCVHLTGINWAYATDLDASQVWAQAYHLYKAGEPWDLQPDEIAEAEKVNETYSICDPLEDLLQRAFELTNSFTDFVPMVDMLDTLRLVHNWRLNSPIGEAMAVGAVMKSWGREKVRRTIATGQREMGYAGLKKR